MEERTTIQVSNELRKELKIIASRRDCSYEDLLRDMIGIFTELDQTKTLISIPSPLAEKIKNRCQGTGFNSISEYVTYVLREVLASTLEKEELSLSTKEENTESNKSLKEELNQKPNQELNQELNQEAEEKIKERLRSLGYLD